MNLSNCTKLTTLSIQFTAISGNLYKLYQTIPSCTIWYCIAYYYNDFDIGSYNNGTSDYKWNHGYGRIQYNHFLNYDNNENVWNGDYYGNYNSYTLSNVSNHNYHNTTLL